MGGRKIFQKYYLFCKKVLTSAYDYDIIQTVQRKGGANDSGEEKEKAEQSQDSGNLTASFDRLNRRNAVNTYR